MLLLLNTISSYGFLKEAYSEYNFIDLLYFNSFDITSLKFGYDKKMIATDNDNFNGDIIVHLLHQAKYSSSIYF